MVNSVFHLCLLLIIKIILFINKHLIRLKDLNGLKIQFKIHPVSNKLNIIRGNCAHPNLSSQR